VELTNAMAVSASGLRAQSLRMRVIAENIANQDSVGSTPGGDPYFRKMVSFRNVLNQERGVAMVEVNRVFRDRNDGPLARIPGHPGADQRGYVRTPNVNGIIEAADMREAQRTYEANIQAIDAAKQMLMRTVDLLR
jgi:flagellar basal-body rod protein FlgC